MGDKDSLALVERCAIVLDRFKVMVIHWVEKTVLRQEEDVEE
jgi:hypothetical protein